MLQQEEECTSMSAILSNGDFQTNNNKSLRSFIKILIFLVLVVLLIYFLVGIVLVFDFKFEIKKKKIKFIIFVINILYFLTTFSGIILHLLRFNQHPDCYFRIKCDNYPMLIAMMLLSLINVSYYCLYFTDLIANKYEISQYFTAFSEFLFSAVILPFVVICVHYKIRNNRKKMEAKFKIITILCVTACLIIYLNKLYIRIERDKKEINESKVQKSINPARNGSNETFFNVETIKCEKVMEIFNMVYFLIAFIFLIEPFRNIASRNEHVIYKSKEKILKLSFLSNLSLVRFRILTLLFTVLLITIIPTLQYIMTQGLNTDENQSIKTAFMLFTIVLYIIAIFYGIMYYIAEISQWPKKVKYSIRNDQYFNILSVLFQVLNGILLSVSYTYHQNAYANKPLFAVNITFYILLIVQVIIQACCINSAMYRKVQRNKPLTCKFAFFPPVIIASVNFVLLLTSMMFSQDYVFKRFDKETKLILNFGIKNLILPGVVLNRLHAMTFFINLSLKQWRNEL